MELLTSVEEEIKKLRKSTEKTFFFAFSSDIQQHVSKKKRSNKIISINF